MNHTIRNVLFFIALASVTACFGGDCDGDNGLTGTGSVIDAYTINISGVTNVDIKVESRYAFNGVQFGNRMGPLRMTSTTLPIDVALHGHGEVAPIYSGTTGADIDACFVAMGSPLNPNVRLMHLISPSSPKARLHVVLGDWTNATRVDVYVTAPGASLAAATPVANNIGFTTNPADLSTFVDVDPGVTRQVRLCATGTKNVLNDLGTIPSIGTTVTKGWNYVIATTNEAGMSSSLLFALPPFTQ